MVNTTLLSLLQSDSAPGGANTYTHMDDPTLLASINTPILTPVTYHITLTTLAGSDVWGFAKLSAFQAALETVASGGGTNGAAANTLLKILGGPGFDATDPQVQALASTFVELSGGTITNDDAAKALNTTSYIVGEIVLQDVTDTRAELARLAGWAALFTPVTSAYTAAVDAYNAAIPTRANRISAITTGINGSSSAPVDLTALDALI